MMLLIQLRIHKKLYDKEDWKVSKNPTAGSTGERKKRPISSSKVKPKKQRIRDGGRLRSRKIIRKFKPKQETEKDLKKMMKAGINTTCKRGRNEMDPDEMLIDLISLPREKFYAQ